MFKKIYNLHRTCRPAKGVKIELRVEAEWEDEYVILVYKGSAVVEERVFENYNGRAGRLAIEEFHMLAYTILLD